MTRPTPAGAAARVGTVAPIHGVRSYVPQPTDDATTTTLHALTFCGAYLTQTRPSARFDPLHGTHPATRCRDCESVRAGLPEQEWTPELRNPYRRPEATA